METPSSPPGRLQLRLGGVQPCFWQRPVDIAGEDRAWPALRCCGLCRAGSCHLFPAPVRGGEVLHPCPVLQLRDQRASPEQVTEIQFTARLGVSSSLGRCVGWSRAAASSATGKDPPLQARNWAVLEVPRGASRVDLQPSSHPRALSALAEGEP